MLAKTLYNLHNYTKETKHLHVITYEGKYFNIVKSYNFLLWEIEEMKSCIYRVEPSNAVM